MDVVVIDGEIEVVILEILSIVLEVVVKEEVEDFGIDIIISFG